MTTKKKKLALFITLLSPGVSQHAVAEWQVSPSLQIRETYTDNVRLDPPGRERDEFVTEVNPGIAVRANSARSRIDLGYRMQNVIYGFDMDSVSTHHQLSARGSTEFVEDLFGIDARASIAQQVLDGRERVGFDNINSIDRDDVVTLGISPHLRFRIADWAQARLRYDVEQLEYSGSALSDSTTYTVTATLASGTALPRVGWNLNYSNQRQELGAAEDSERENATGGVSYRFSRRLSVLGQAGWENNDIRTTRRDVRDGTWWSAGFGWRPNRRLYVEGLTGNNNTQARVDYTPSVRTSMALGYRLRDVGLNPGVSWDAKVSHRARMLTTSLRYLEESTNTQLVQQAGRAVYFLRDAEGDYVRDASTGLPRFFLLDVFTLTDEEFIRKRGELAFHVHRARTDGSLVLFHERREFELAREPEEGFGLDTSVAWRMAPRTKLLADAGWQHQDFGLSGQLDDIWDVGVGVSRRVNRNIDTNMEYRHTERESNLVNREYRENRITAGVNIRF